MNACVNAFGYGDPEQAFKIESAEACFKWLPTSCLAKKIGWPFVAGGVGSYDPIDILLGVGKNEPVKGGLFALM